jgi:nitroreductase
MNEIIRKRKSVRKYDPAKLDTETLEKIKEQIDDLTPLYPDIRYSIKIVDKTKLALGVKAPHYLVFGSEEKEGGFENIGYIGQQMDLFFSGSGLGSCWLGTAKPDQKEDSELPFVICMAFGNPAEPLYRDSPGFKRKPLSAISEGADERLEAARLAPSARNEQNWHFIAENGKIHCYRRKSNTLVGLLVSKLAKIDMGIALCHIAKESGDFHFANEADVPDRKGCVYLGTVAGKNEV